MSSQSVPGSVHLRQLRRPGEGLGVVQRAGVGDDQADAEDEAEVADPVDQEAFMLAKIAVGFVEPETDQQVRPDPRRWPENSCRKLLDTSTSISMEKVNSEM